MDIANMLDTLADYQHEVAVRRMAYEERRDSIIAQLKPELDALDAEFQPAIADAEDRIASMEATIKQATLENAASVKGRFLQAVWSKGRVSWDTKKLDGLLIVLPQLGTCRTEGSPSVSIRRIA